MTLPVVKVTKPYYSKVLTTPGGHLITGLKLRLEDFDHVLSRSNVRSESLDRRSSITVVPANLPSEANRLPTRRDRRN